MYRFSRTLHRRRAVTISLILAIVLALSACGSAKGDKPTQQAPAIPVRAKTVAPHSVDVYSEYPGRAAGRRTVQVVARVEGILLKRHYTEGAIVHAGDLLYTIDPKPFQATVDQRKAALAMAKADLDNAQRVWSRTRQLYKSNAVSRAERDKAISTLKSDRAAVQQAQANLESARIDLGYTRVKAPITGVTSRQDVDGGSLVNNGTQLTTITQFNPAYVLFALPEDDAIARDKALRAMANKGGDATTRRATIILPDGVKMKGVVDFTQSTIDPDTGTVQLRAIVANPNNVLMPGRYVRARIRVRTLHHAIVVPDIAISDNQQRTRVYVVSKQGKAKPMPVVLGPNVAGGRVISKGLAAGDRVIVSGFGQLKPGALVKVKPNKKTTVAQADPPAARTADHARPKEETASVMRFSGTLPLSRFVVKPRQGG
jgi:membrane fusion protein (multidrug efflux system)